MAELAIEGDELVLHLSGAEKLESVHGDQRVPLSGVTGVEVLDDAHGPADMVGLRVGTRIPRVVEVASVSGLSRKIFAAVHHDTPRGVRVFLGEGTYDEWIVGCADPEGVVARLGLPRAGS
ncbi:MAG TPA: hypothetical protein VMD59_01335 [Acidimicrobiales bacterium]|nr:hypothetical protein [Acidimicrobiales bacterium]